LPRPVWRTTSTPIISTNTATQGAAEKLADAIAHTATRPWVVMEVCGGQTHTIVKYGIDRMLPPEVELVHGPGCPVCVTSLEMIDRAHAIASRPNVTFCSFGDMLRVPGSRGDLLESKSKGSDIRNPDADRRKLECVQVGPCEVRAGDRVRLRPRGGADIMDLALAGMTAAVESIEQDFEGRVYLAVTVDDDPGRDLGALRQPGHRFFFQPDEVEPL
jgi:Hydrogenase formation hypA family